MTTARVMTTARMMTTNRHRPSKALTNEENNALFSLMGHGCEAKATGVVQVFVTAPPHHGTWFKRAVGVASFSKDLIRRSFYIQVYDITVMAQVLEQEIYREFEYNNSVPFFHQFEGEEGMVGLNFSNDEDALSFSNAVTQVLANRKRRKEERRLQLMAQQQRKLSEGLDQPQQQRQHQEQQQQQKQQQQQQQQQKQQQQQQQQQQHQHHHHHHHHDEPKHKDKRLFGKIGTRREKRRFSKSMIGDPFGFQHVSHAGFDNNNTFSSFNVDQELEHLFTVVGLDKNKMADDKTRKFVYDFIENHGGFEEAKKASRKYSTRRVLDDPSSEGPPSGRAHGPSAGVRGHGPHAPGSRSSYSEAPIPPPPARDPPPPPSGGPSNVPSGQHYQNSNGGPCDDNSDAPFPPPPKNYHSAPPSPSVDTVPPPPAHSATSIPPPPLPMPKSNILVPPPPPMPKNVDIASSQHFSHYYVPPPPPFSKGSTIPHPPPPPPSSGIQMSTQVDAGGLHPSLDPRSALLDQIRCGTKPLKKVGATSQSVQTDSRAQLLDDIKNGTFRLHKVSLSESDTKGDEHLGLEGIALDLHRALQERAQFIQPDDESGDSTPDDDDDSEWDTD